MGPTIPTTLTDAGVFLSGSGEFNLQKDSNEYFRYTKTGGLDISAANFDLLTSTQHISSSVGGVIAMGPTIPTALDDSGIMLSGSGEFNLQKDSNEYFRYTKTGGLDISAANFDLLTSTQHISSSGGGVIAMGPTIPTTLTDAGVFLSGSGEFNFRVDSNNYIRQVGDTFDIKSNTFNLATSTVSMSSANNGKLAMGLTPPTAFNSGNGFYVDGDSNLLIGSASGDHIQYNSDTNAFDVQVGSLELDLIVVMVFM